MSMTLHLRIWRQKEPEQSGALVPYTLEGLSSDMSVLEMLDTLNERITEANETPIEFESDCREGICGSCGFMMNGQAHGPERGAAVCQVYLRKFRDGDTIIIEPWRVRAFPVLQDLVVDRNALDRIVKVGGYVSVRTGPHPDGNTVLIPKDATDRSLDAGACIQCGACAAACPNASAALFTGAQITRFVFLPQGKTESKRRASRMIKQMDDEGFGHCTNIGECEAACPKKISLDVIVQMRREYWKTF